MIEKARLLKNTITCAIRTMWAGLQISAALIGVIIGIIGLICSAIVWVTN